MFLVMETDILRFGRIPRVVLMIRSNLERL
jgi:hypothetical protein